MATTQDVSVGNFIRYNGELVQVIEWQHRTPGNLRAFYQGKMRRVKDGKSAENRFRSGEAVEIVRVEVKELAYLYADGDGVKNAEEAEAKSNPADAQSTPAKKGQWLDVSSLIPKEVQALFPAVREYLPRDAVLTQSDIDRAKAMGVDLNRKDDNTIYIPLAEQRPAGSALIYPAQYKGKVFYLLLATDRQLNITQVKPLNTRLVPEAANAKVYESFKGIALDKLPAGNGSDLDAAISNATRKAGTLVFVRLKGA